ncbi:MAG: hypothetical protein WBO70_08380 [Erysipelotrichaceae bacterium]
MEDIIKIVIKGHSYWRSRPIYDDKVTITPEQISYEYIPISDDDDIYLKRKWSYKTTNPIFKMKFTKICELLKKAFETVDRNMGVLDVQGINFIVVFADRTKYKVYYPVPADEFEELFRAIKNIVPQCEDIPKVLVTSEDFKKIREMEKE